MLVGMFVRRFLGFTAVCGACGLGLPAFSVLPSATPPVSVAVSAVDDSRLAELEKETGDRPVDSILEQALAYDERGQAARAADLYRLAAAQGVGVAELRLGWFNESGTGAEQNYTLARSHYERAASLGVPEANLRLGLLYLEGWGVPKDPATAVAHLRLAANAGYSPAQKILSEMYFSGTGVTADLREALQWAEKVATQRGPEAQALVGSIREKAAHLPQDLQAAREWYQLSAEQEYAGGMLRMAATFFKPSADPANVQLGLRWLELAAESGSTAAAFYLAGMHLTSPLLRNAPDHEEKALKFLTLSAQGGEYAATEVLELARSSKSLTDAFVYVLTVPVDVRYVQRVASTPPTAEEIATHKVRPRPIKMVQPIYPTSMRLTGTEAEVMVEFVIDQTGRVRDAHAISSPHPAFADPAVAAVMTWRFIPGYENGQAVNTRAHIPMQFKMTDLSGPYQSSSPAKPEAPGKSPP